MMNRAPIAVFAYNRPDHVERVLEALARNPEAGESKLIIFSDAPRSLVDADKVAQLRDRIRHVRGFLSVDIVEQPINQGIARSIILGVSHLTEKFGKVIVIEDDLLPSVHFLGYMNAALDLYENDNRVISVHGYTYPVEEPLPETFFLRGADCWGWATWKRGWAVFEPDGQKLLCELESRGLSYEFDFSGNYPFTQMLRDCIDGRNDSWAIRWYASAFLRGKLTLYPGSSQIQNIGADGTGVHVDVTSSFEHRKWGRRLTVGDIGVEESAVSRCVFSNYFSRLRGPPLKRAFRKLYKLIQGA